MSGSTSAGWPRFRASQFSAAGVSVGVEQSLQIVFDLVTCIVCL